MPFELEQLLLFQSPLELTYRALLELLLQFGERSHQLVADSSRTLYQAGNPQDTLIFFCSFRSSRTIAFTIAACCLSSA